ncbi:MAG: 3-dehydroquinate synthase [Leptospirales bacterium]|jgi:3-dehydroquinate synthase
MSSESETNYLTVEPRGAPSYPVYVETDFSRLRAGADFADLGASQFFLISQTGLEQSVVLAFMEAMRDRVPGGLSPERVILIGQGEASKHISRLAPVYNRLIELDVDRKSCLIALGGGVVGDFTGFVAATLLRGVSFVQVPTTLLAAVDSSVGGKTAVNVDRGKNMVGAFYQPRFVYFNTQFLRTLPRREWVCGLAEMVKHACLDETGLLLADLERNGDRLRDPGAPELRKAVLDSAAFKARVVSADEREGGLRAILNLGHTTAHSLESLTDYKRFSHGEAVARGLVTALLLSRRVLGLADAVVERYLKLFESLGLPGDTAGFAPSEVLDHMRFDKKSVRGIPRFVLLEDAGRPRYGIQVPEAEFLAAFAEQAERFGGGARQVPKIQPL